ncbi:hypothetical protein AQUCO_00100060v1 [Aquilegia coerulea]|uniref:Late embryogenesis abundant protein LEA-2 subgroup domain-containing protein n=1 Tax=Aquilegia coerulea TaxID=218851 RepID=A0A2G5F8L8_AQUCA|nr:hypothetical protein AQUCO_00100060v1 [Aquilegia coerulea]
MADRVYPSSKPILNPPPQTLNGTTMPTTNNPTFPQTKAQLYGATRPPYRPQPKPRRRRRSCCCACFLWTTLLIIALLLIIAIAGAVFWVLYHPQRPSFSVKTLRITQFNITTPKNSSPLLLSKLNLTITSRNPNKKLVFIYNPISVSLKSNDIDVGNGSFPSFVHGKKNTTDLKFFITSGTGKELDEDSMTKLETDLKKKDGLPLEIELETKVQVKIGGFKTNRVRIRVTCKGYQVTAPKGKTPSMMKNTSSNSKCKVNLRIKIWKFTI